MAIYTAGPGDNIARACEQLRPGDTLQLETGLYTSRVRITAAACANGTADKPITITSADKNRPAVFRGGGKGPQFCIEDLSHWHVTDLRFDSYTAGGGLHAIAKTAASIADGGAMRGIVFARNTFFRQEPNQAGQSMHVILIVTRSNDWPIADCAVSHNTLIECIPCAIGAGLENGNECITFIGNVQDSSIDHNRLEDCYAIGLNLIGSEATMGWQGQPKDCRITDNYVEIDKHPSWKTRNHAVAIYSDRALSGCRVERNHVVAGRLAIGINMEPSQSRRLQSTQDYVIANNVFVSPSNGVAGFGQGGMAQSSQAPNFMMQDISVRNNVFVCTDNQGSGRVIRLGRSEGLDFSNNVVELRGNGGMFLSQPTPFVSQAQMDTWRLHGNVYYAGRPRWEMNGKRYDTFAEYDSEVDQERGGEFGKPIYVNEDDADYRLASGSPGYGRAGLTDGTATPEPPDKPEPPEEAAWVAVDVSDLEAREMDGSIEMRFRLRKKQTRRRR